jgi:hypothetical protein
LILKIGDAIDIDTYFSVFSSGKIKEQHKKGKLIKDFTEAMPKDGIKISTQTVTKWLASCYSKADEWEEKLNQEQNKKEEASKVVQMVWQATNTRLYGSS